MSTGSVSYTHLLGGLLGCILMIPIRKFLIKDEHGKLPYPEGTACAEVIVAGKEGGTTSKMLFKGIGIGGVFKFLTNGFCLFPEELDIPLKGYLKGGAVGMDVYPSLLGAGFLDVYKRQIYNCTSRQLLSSFSSRARRGAEPGTNRPEHPRIHP